MKSESIEATYTEIDKILERMLATAAQREQQFAAEPPPPQPSPRLPTNPGVFRLHGVADCVRQAYNCVEACVRDIIAGRKNHRWVTLFGRSGSGKTHLLQLAHYTLRKSGVHSILRNWSLISDELFEFGNDQFDRLCRAPVLLLDDIGCDEFSSDKRARVIGSKLCRLFEARLGKWTLMSAGLSPHELGDQVSHRAASRLFRGSNELVDMRNAEDHGFLDYKQRTQNPQPPANNDCPPIR